MSTEARRVRPALAIAASMALLLGVVGIYGVIATVLASYLPARRAVSVEPVEALRSE